MTEIEFVGYSAVHPSDFIYDVPNGFTGYLLLLFGSPSELLIDGRLMRTAGNFLTIGQKIGNTCDCCFYESIRCFHIVVVPFHYK